MPNSPMRYRLLGASGLRVSELCLGAMTFGMPDWGTEPDEAARIYDAFREAGGNFVDTANEIYGGGRSEEIVGGLIADHRDAVVLATKYTDSPPGDDPNRGGNHRKSMVQSVERSLKRLATDRIDLLWVHSWDFMTPAAEVMRGLDDLVRAGKVLYIGISDAPAWVVSRCNMLAELRGWTPFVGLQIEYNLAERTVERELTPMAGALDLSILAWSPLAAGLLSGKYAKDADPGGGRRLDTMKLKPVGEREHRIAAAVGEIATELGRTSPQVALAWLRQRPERVVPIIGARTTDQFADNLGCLDTVLPDDPMRRLDEVSVAPLGFPHEFLQATAGPTYGGLRDRIDPHRDRGFGVRSVLAP